MNALELHQSLTTYAEGAKALRCLPRTSNNEAILKASLEALFQQPNISNEGAKEFIQNQLTKISNALKGKKYFEDIRKSDYLKLLKSNTVDELIKQLQGLKGSNVNELNAFENALNQAFLDDPQVHPYLFDKSGKLLDLKKQHDKTVEFSNKLYQAVKQFAIQGVHELSDEPQNVEVIQQSNFKNIKPEIDNIEYSVGDKGINIDLIKPNKPKAIQLNDLITYYQSVKVIAIDLERKLNYFDDLLNQIFNEARKLPTNKQAAVNGLIQSTLNVTRLLFTNILLNIRYVAIAITLSESHLLAANIESMSFESASKTNGKVRGDGSAIFEFLKWFMDNFFKALGVYFITLLKWWIIAFFSALLLGATFNIMPIVLGLTVYELIMRFMDERKKAKGDGDSYGII